MGWFSERKKRKKFEAWRRIFITRYDRLHNRIATVLGFSHNVNIMDKGGDIVAFNILHHQTLRLIELSQDYGDVLVAIAGFEVSCKLLALKLEEDPDLVLAHTTGIKNSVTEASRRSVHPRELDLYE